MLFVDLGRRRTSVKTTYKTFAVYIYFRFRRLHVLYTYNLSKWCLYKMYKHDQTISQVLKSNFWRVLGYLEPLCSAASTTTQFDAETLDAVSAAYCTTHHLTSMESLWEKSGKTKTTTLLQSYYESWSNSQDITLLTAEDVWIFATSP